jgi:hypothetical protein
MMMNDEKILTWNEILKEASKGGFITFTEGKMAILMCHEEQKKMGIYENTQKSCNLKGKERKKMNNLRPVVVSGGKWKNKEGVFHTWGHWADEDGAGTQGIVEFEDGRCEAVHSDWIKFIDRDREFCEKKT